MDSKSHEAKLFVVTATYANETIKTAIMKPESSI